VKHLHLYLSLATLVACGNGSGDDDDGANDAGATPALDATAASDAGDDSASQAAGLSGPEVVLETTMGSLVVRLAESEMPTTTANFLAYVDSDFYDATLIHRVVQDWVIQGGGYSSGLVSKTPNAPIPLETSSNVKHVHGAISMAHSSDPDSATSQWFIVDWPDSADSRQPSELDGQYAAFGVLIEGFDVLEAISQVETQSTGGLDDVPVTEILVSSARRR
jgi:cyclophilin family peptidyl-prolyl cis-trans isomerase